jgi:hypothetical protein
MSLVIEAAVRKPKLSAHQVKIARDRMRGRGIAPAPLQGMGRGAHGGGSRGDLELTSNPKKRTTQPFQGSTPSSRERRLVMLHCTIISKR